MTDALVQARQVGVLNRQRRRRVAPAPLLFLVKKVASRLTATNHKTNGTFVTVFISLCMGLYHKGVSRGNHNLSERAYI